MPSRRFPPWRASRRMPSRASRSLDARNDGVLLVRLRDPRTPRRLPSRAAANSSFVLKNSEATTVELSSRRFCSSPTDAKASDSVPSDSRIVASSSSRPLNPPARFSISRRVWPGGTSASTRSRDCSNRWKSTGSEVSCRGIVSPSSRNSSVSAIGVRSTNCSPTALLLLTRAETTAGILSSHSDSMRSSISTPSSFRVMSPTFPMSTPR